MITHEGLKNLKIMAPSGYDNVKYSFIAPKEWPELASILSKGYHALPPDFHNVLQQQWFTLQILEKADYALLWRVLAIVVFIGAWALWWHRRVLMAKRETEKVLIRLQHVQRQLEDQNVRLETLAVTDKLTGLYNRQKLDNTLLNEHERGKRYGTIFGVILIDIDHFKQVNDTHGHQVGDLVLKNVADILKKRTRKLDTAGRWGGEEFMIICNNIDGFSIQKVAEQLRISIANYDFPTQGHLTASFGLSLYKLGDSIENVISVADKALYLAKENGRNQVIYQD